MNLTLIFCGFLPIGVLSGLAKSPRELHFKKQVLHIDDVLGGGVKSFRPEQTIEELNMAAKKKAKKAKKATKKKAAKKKK